MTRPEFARPGVYVLVGPPSSASFDGRVYIGEGDLLRDRIDSHNKSKDFWTRLVAFSSSDGGLNKALIKYIESRLAKLAADAGRAEIDNGNVPPQPALSEADLADAEAFLHDMLVIYPLVGVTAFEALPAAGSAPQVEDLFIKSATADARGREVADEFVVFKGSRIGPMHQALPGSLKALRETLVAEGKLEESNGGSLLLLQDRNLQSPSYSAAFVLGSAANGRTAWKNGNGVSLKALAEGQPAQAGGA